MPQLKGHTAQHRTSAPANAPAVNLAAKGTNGGGVRVTANPTGGMTAGIASPTRATGKGSTSKHVTKVNPGKGH